MSETTLAPTVKSAEWVEIRVSVDPRRLTGAEAHYGSVPSPDGFWTAQTLAGWSRLFYSTPREFLEAFDLLGHTDVVITLVDSEGRQAQMGF